MTLQMRPGRFRHTVILASTEKGLHRFDSLDAMPAVLRARCLKALESLESGTVVIAGQAGSDTDSSPLYAPAALPPGALPPPGQTGGTRLALWLRLAVAAAAAAAILHYWRL